MTFDDKDCLDPQGAEDQPTVKVYCGDCRELIPKIVAMFGAFKFIFADPPFNVGMKYKGYWDQRNDFPEFMEEWIRICWAACNGVMALHGPDKLVRYYTQAQRELQMRQIAWVNWHYRFGQCGRTNWIDARAHCLIFSKNRNSWTWNPDDVLVDSDRATTYGDKRIHDTENGGQRLPGTVWGVPSDGPYWGRVQGNSKERRKGHPNQLPEVYLERLIKAYTNPGDWILDPFAGSGTTGVVAQALGRNCVTIDISRESCKSVKERLRKGAVRVYS